MKSKFFRFWCIVEASGAILLYVSGFSVMLVPWLFALAAAVVCFIKTVITFFSHGNVATDFDRLLVSVTLYVASVVTSNVYSRKIRYWIMDRYGIDHFAAYAKNHLVKPASKVMDSMEGIHILAIVVTAIAPSIGICYGMYRTIVDLHLAIFILIVSALAIIASHAIAIRVCIAAWRKIM